MKGGVSMLTIRTQARNHRGGKRGPYFKQFQEAQRSGAILGMGVATSRMGVTILGMGVAVRG